MRWLLSLCLVLMLAIPAHAVMVPAKHPANPRYFVDSTGQAVPFTGSHTWCNFSNYNYPGAPETCTLDYAAYLNFMQARNHTFMRMWACAEDLGTALIPYQRTGPGLANDGQAKVNLTSFNATWFSTLRQRIIDAGAKGISVGIVLFCQANFYGTWWDMDWMNPANNVQGIDGDQLNTFTLANTPKVTIQEDFIKHVIDTVNDLDNVLYEIGNELPSSPSSVPWQNHMIDDVIHAYEAGKPKQHPVGMTALGGSSGGVSELFSSNAEWISPGGTGGYPEYRDDPPAATGTKVILMDTDHIGMGVSDGGNANVVWKNFTRGNQVLIMETPDLMSNSDKEPARKAAGQTVLWARSLNFAAMTPQNALASTGYCLASSGQSYFVWQPGSGAFTVNLGAISKTFTVTWWRADTQVEVPASAVTGSGTTTFTPPFAGAAALKVAAVAAVSASGAVDGGADYLLPSYAIGPLAAIMPVVTSHPLLQNMLDWFRVAPPWAAGPRWYSIVSARTGVLTNMDAAAGWGTSVRRGSQGAMRFDGVNDTVLLPGTGSGPLDLTSPFTIMAWVLLTDLGTTNHNIVNKGYDSGSNTVQLYFSVGSTAATLVCGSYNGGTDHLVTAATPLTSVWTHAACTYDGSTWSLYLNGSPDAQATATGPVHNPSNVVIGGQEENGGSSFSGFWPGALDDILVWNRSLGALEIRQAYELSRLGWPGVLRRQRDILTANVSASTILPPARPGSLLPFTSPRKGR